MTAPLARLGELLDMIKFQHSLFALPFALTAVLAASDGLPSLRVLALVVLCMVSARTAAMTFNRLADRRLDADNPRTRERSLPAGRVSVGSAVALLVVSSAAFLAAAAAINPLTRLLGPVALAVVLAYSLTKRFTWASHFVLGLSLALAPLGAWIAVTGELSTAPLLLGAAVLLWTAGFDLLYACQDGEHDRRVGLHSVPARFGVRASLHLARASHLAALLALVAFGWTDGLGIAYHCGVGLSALVMAWSHSIVRADDLTRVGVAFFQANAVVAALILAGTAVDVLAG